MIEFCEESTVEFLECSGSDQTIADAARVANSGGEAEGLINYLMKHRHGTPFEHNHLRFFVDAPLFVWREWHRHRIGFSYNEESGRYKVLRPKFYVPPPNRPMMQVDNWVPARPKFDLAPTAVWASVVEELKEGYTLDYQRYLRLLSKKIDPGLARDCLPVGIFSRCWVTCNLRSALNFLSLRVFDTGSTFLSYPLWEIDRCAQVIEFCVKSAFPLCHAAFINNGRVAP